MPLKEMSLENKLRQKKKRPRFHEALFIISGDDLLSHTVARAVQSALEGLTSVFEMGTGVTPPAKSPENLINRIKSFACQANRQIKLITDHRPMITASLHAKILWSSLTTD
jgi:hypothetical protein